MTMWSKFRGSRLFYMILAVLAAVICWLYVDLARQPDARVTISNIPITYAGEEQLNEMGLLILDENPTISIRVEGPRSVITRLNRENITITVSTAGITEAGVYSLECSINLPGSVTSATSNPVAITSRSATEVDVTVVEMVSNTVPIRAEFTGTLAENRFYDEDSFVLEQTELEIRGEESEVNQVSYAKVELSEMNLTDTWTGRLPVVLCDAQGNELDTENLLLETDMISVAFYVECYKEVPLTVTLLSGGGASSENADYTIDPPTITVTGQEAVLEDLTEVSLGTIDLSQVITTEQFEFDIVLPDQVSSRDGVTSATVTVSVTGLETRMIETSNIQLLNAPEGYHYQYDSLTVRVRGRTEDFDMLLTDDIQVTADLSGVNIEAGSTVTVPVEVEIVGISELGVLGSYTLPITVTAAEEDPSTTVTAEGA